VILASGTTAAKGRGLLVQYFGSVCLVEYQLSRDNVGRACYSSSLLSELRGEIYQSAIRQLNIFAKIDPPMTNARQLLHCSRFQEQGNTGIWALVLFATARSLQHGVSMDVSGIWIGGMNQQDTSHFNLVLHGRRHSGVSRSIVERPYT